MANDLHNTPIHHHATVQMTFNIGNKICFIYINQSTKIRKTDSYILFYIWNWKLTLCLYNVSRFKIKHLSLRLMKYFCILSNKPKSNCFFLNELLSIYVNRNTRNTICIDVVSLMFQKLSYMMYYVLQCMFHHYPTMF